jgi:hypothetical protein
MVDAAPDHRGGGIPWPYPLSMEVPMTTVQRTALLFGVVFLLVALAGLFVPGGTSMRSEMEGAPLLFGLFPVNLAHNLVHLLFGVWGVVASRGFGAAVTYARIGGIAYLLLAVLGFFMPELPGLMPIGGYDVWLHLVLGAALAAVGFTAREHVRTTGGHAA